MEIGLANTLRPAIAKLCIHVVEAISNSGAELSHFKKAVEKFARLSITLLGEGIESQAQVAKLQVFGVTLGQRYLYSKPTPLNELMIGTNAAKVIHHKEASLIVYAKLSLTISPSEYTINRQ